MEPYMAYVTFKSIVGNRYVIQLSQIVSVQSIHTTNMRSTIVIRTTSGKSSMLYKLHMIFAMK